MLSRPHSANCFRTWLAALVVSFALPAGVHAATVGVDDVTFDTGFGIYKIKHMDVTGANLDAAGIKALLTGSGPLAERLAKLTAERIDVPEMVFEQTVGGIKQTASYRDGKLTGFANGKASTLDFASASIAGDTSSPVPLSAELKGLHGANIDFAALASMMTDSAKPPGGQQRLPIYGEGSVQSFVIKLPNMEISIGPSSVRNISVRPLAVPIANLLSRLPKPTPPGEKPTPEELKNLSLFMEGVFDVYGAIAIGSLDLGPMKLAVTGHPGTGHRSDHRQYRTHDR